MQKEHVLPAWGYLLICAFLSLLACAKPNIQMPESPPPIIKAYKNLSIFGSQIGMRSTGIYLESGDVYSILATGSMDFGVWTPYRNVTPELGWPIMMRIGDNHMFRLFSGYNGITTTSYQSGDLYMGYKRGQVSALGEPYNPQWYGYTKGGFNVDIIVWEKADWIQIADFFAQMIKKDPDNKALQDALADAERYKSVYLSEQKAKEAIAATQKQISALKKEAEQEEKTGAQPVPQEEQSAEGLSKEEKITQLQARLAKLL